MAIESTITFGTSAALVPNPIRPEWIIEGAPQARALKLSGSADGTASTYLWDCTAGRFNWFYSFDETFHILEGGVLLVEPSGASRHVGPGDTVFFPDGSQAEWTVERYVKKLAFCRTPLPGSLVSARNALRRVKRLVRGGSSNDGLL
jgi:uncharacterized cupin superfamily protein